MTSLNHTPWIEQLDTRRDFPALTAHESADVVIVGAGIAGVTTAFQILTNTDLSVCLLEARKIARGATGHNAGQVVLYFEKPFREIVTEYGLEKAIDGQKSLFQGWDLLGDILAKIDSNIMEKCTGYMGIGTLQQLLLHLENKYLRDTGGAQFDAIFIDKTWDKIHEIPAQFHDLISYVDADFIREKLETNAYFPIMLTSRKACVNSALLCQEIISYMLIHFPHRFTLHEHSPMTEVRCFPDKKTEAWVGEFCVSASEIVLCTNGFENFHIVDLHHGNSRERDKIFHKNICGRVGYMAGFFTPHESPSAISYYPDAAVEKWEDEEYFYVTSRTTELRGDKESLICIGGPDDLLPHEMHYDESTHDPREAYKKIHTFLKKYRRETIPDVLPYTWHGLMGYTQTGLRHIGQDPHTPHLWYNLGCNGTGIVSSVYGAWKIAKTLSGVAFPPSIFDPQ